MSTFGILRLLRSTRIYLFIHLLNKQLLITHYVPSNLLDTDNLTTNEIQHLSLGSFRLMGRQTNKQIIIICHVTCVMFGGNTKWKRRTEERHLRENFLKRGIWHPIIEHFWDLVKNSELCERKCVAGVSGQMKQHIERSWRGKQDHGLLEIPRGAEDNRSIAYAAESQDMNLERRKPRG